MSGMLDRELRALDDAVARGEMDQRDADREARELMRDYEANRREAASDAYDREYGRW